MLITLIFLIQATHLYTIVARTTFIFIQTFQGGMRTKLNKNLLHCLTFLIF